MAKKRVQIRVQNGAFGPIMVQAVDAHYTKGDWAVTGMYGKPYNRFRDFNYWLTHIPTGLGCGRFRTQKAAIACCREVADLPCDATIGVNGKQVWPSAQIQGPPIQAVLQKWVDGEKEQEAA